MSRYSISSICLILTFSFIANAQDPPSSTKPLHDAAEKGDLQQVKENIYSGRPVDEMDSEQRTPLMLACKAGKVEVVQYLLSSDANVYRQDTNGNYPLHYGAMCSDVAIITSLLQWVSDTTLPNREGKTALDIAIELENQAVVDILSSFRSSHSYTQQRDYLAEAEAILADPNTILENLKKHPDLTETFAELEKSIRQEQSAWTSRRVTGMSRLPRALATQVTKEFGVVISIAKAADANDVTKAMSTISDDWNKRFDFVSKRMREKMREQMRGNNPAMARRQSRRRPLPTRQTEEYGYTEQQSPEDAERQRMEQDMSSWVQSSAGNKGTLCEKVKTDYLNDMMSVREVADTSKVDKAKVAIDALMLKRVNFLDTMVVKIEEISLRESQRNMTPDGTSTSGTRGRRRR